MIQLFSIAWRSARAHPKRTILAASAFFVLAGLASAGLYWISGLEKGYEQLLREQGRNPDELVQILIGIPDGEDGIRATHARAGTELITAVGEAVDTASDARPPVDLSRSLARSLDLAVGHSVTVFVPDGRAYTATVDALIPTPPGSPVLAELAASSAAQQTQLTSAAVESELLRVFAPVRTGAVLLMLPLLGLGALVAAASTLLEMRHIRPDLDLLEDLGYRRVHRHSLVAMYAAVPAALGAILGTVVMTIAARAFAVSEGMSGLRNALLGATPIDPSWIALLQPQVNLLPASLFVIVPVLLAGTAGASTDIVLGVRRTP